MRNLNVVRRDRLELQASRCEIGEHLFFRSYCSTRADPDEVIGVDSVERRRIRMDLGLNALLIHLPDFLDGASLALALRLRMSRNGGEKQETSHHETSLHGRSSKMAARCLPVPNAVHLKDS
jgi:hypothetical protein